VIDCKFYYLLVLGRTNLQRDKRKNYIFGHKSVDAVAYKKYGTYASVERYIFLLTVSSIQDSNLFARFHWKLEKNVAPRRHSQWTSIFLHGTQELQATPTSGINGCGCK